MVKDANGKPVPRAWAGITFPGLYIGNSQADDRGKVVFEVPDFFPEGSGYAAVAGLEEEGPYPGYETFSMSRRLSAKVVVKLP